METSKTIRVRVVQWYGRTTAYPECETSRILAELAGTKTLTKRSLELAQQLGYEIELVTTEPKLGDLK